MSIDNLSEKQAALLQKLRSGAMRLGASSPGIQRIPAGERLPVSGAQRRIVFEELLHPGNTFNGTLTLDCRADVDLDILRKSLDFLVSRHAILRSNVFMSDGEIWAGYNEPGSVEFEVYSVPVEGDDLAARVAEVGNAFARQHISIFFDAALIRAAVIRIGDDRMLLVLAMHMYAFDAPSGSIFAKELALAYQNLSVGSAPKLPPMDYEYADLVAWQAEHDQRDDAGSVAFWQTQFSTVNEELRLPVDRARPSVPQFAADRFPFTVEPSLVATLRALARHRGVSIYVLLLAVLKVTLARHSEQATVAVGAWTVQRDARSAKLIGPLVNTLVYRSAIDRTRSFSSILEEVKGVAANAFAHSRLPFEKVVALSRVSRDSRINPLFQVHFILQEMGNQQSSEHFSLSRFDARIGASGGYDVELVMRDLERGLEGHFECNTTLFTPEESSSLHSRFLRVLSQVLEKPDSLIGELSLSETGTILNGGPPPNESKDLLKPLDGHHEIAVVGENGISLSSDDLEARIADLSQTISATVPKTAVIGIACDDRLLALIAILSSFRAGIPFLVEDANFNADIEISIAARLIPDPQSISGVSLRHVSEAGASTSAPRDGRRVAYYAWSSGTAGKRRVRAIFADRFEVFVSGIAHAYDLDANTIALAHAEPSSDVFLEETIPVLLAGGRLVLSSSSRRGVATLSEDIDRYGVTLLNIPSTYWEAWYRFMQTVGADTPRTLRTIIVGSDEVSIDRLREWRRQFGERVSIIVAYGVSEHAVTSLIYSVPSDPELLEALPRIPVGKPLAGQLAFVSDLVGCPLPPGAVGEIRLGHADEEDTLGTGDFGRVRFDGDIEWLGRMDGRTKRLGSWVEEVPVGVSISTETSQQGARTFVERFLIELWTDVLGSKPSVDENLFDMGAVSMDFMRVLGALEARFGPLTIADIYDRQSISVQADWLALKRE